MISKKSFLFILPFLILTNITLAQVPDEYFDYMDLFELQMVDNPEISPDGNTIIYERHQFDAMTDRRFVNLWKTSFAGNEHVPLTSGTNPVWQCELVARRHPHCLYLIERGFQSTVCALARKR